MTVSAVLEGSQHVELTARSLMRTTSLPISWREQRQVLGFSWHCRSPQHDGTIPFGATKKAIRDAWRKQARFDEIRAVSVPKPKFPTAGKAQNCAVFAKKTE